MKKLAMFALVAGMFAFAACGGGSKEKQKQESIRKAESAAKEAKKQESIKAAEEKAKAEAKAKELAELSAKYSDSVAKKQIVVKDGKITMRGGKALKEPVALPEGVTINAPEKK
jgi:hypothetical protein